MATTSKQKAGRKYSVDTSGITTLKKDFIVVLDDVMAANGETASFTGVPAIGTAHPTHTGLYVTSYDVEEGQGSDKKTLVVTVNYAQKTVETSGEGSSAVSCIVDEWGWDDGTDEKELTAGVDGTQVLNSAGDPFDSVPKVMAPAPTFTKVMRFKARQTGWDSSMCKVNASQVTIGGITCPIGSLLCTVSEKRIIGNEEWKYQYTIRLRYKSNLVKIAGADTATDIGWDVAIADAGMREKVTSGSGASATTEKKLIRMIDKETGKLCTVTSPALLDGQGGKLADDGDPYNFRFQAYGRASFPNWFYSEPTLAEEGLD